MSRNQRFKEKAKKLKKEEEQKKKEEEEKAKQQEEREQKKEEEAWLTFVLHGFGFVWWGTRPPARPLTHPPTR